MTKETESSKEFRIARARLELEKATRPAKTRPQTPHESSIDMEQYNHELEMLERIIALEDRPRKALDNWIEFATRHATEITKEFPLMGEYEDIPPDRSKFLFDAKEELQPIMQQIIHTKLPIDIVAFQTAQKLEPAYKASQLPKKFWESHATLVVDYLHTLHAPYRPAMPRK